jgi:hypothetical protein
MAQFCSDGIHDCIKIHSKPCTELQKNIIDLVSEGVPLVRALEVYLIDPSDFGRMRILAESGDRELMKFAQRCLQAEISFEISLVRTAIKNPNAAAKLLENRFSSTWKNYTESDIEKMSASELQRFIESQEKRHLLLDMVNITKAVENED